MVREMENNDLSLSIRVFKYFIIRSPETSSFTPKRIKFIMGMGFLHKVSFMKEHLDDFYRYTGVNEVRPVLESQISEGDGTLE